MRASIRLATAPVSISMSAGTQSMNPTDTASTPPTDPIIRFPSGKGSPSTSYGSGCSGTSRSPGRRPPGRSVSVTT
ncbi:hypothetical protein PF010_g20418 [Phytophthora fragariae]|uniref:Uncharacterized protein n=1 Tax=Phytophthora fragariae TaxID=53985 RepID=A0A6A4BRY6_9STRA|nr:hypothetical protein PF010_g20418 [Phytophthora fragariae]KAE9279313.1 hypothetical protein PF001_g24775 [Phytophthora fragariae]KAE9311547.1 hypothetical protein PF008_g20184 [Phytophthora fragariae]